MADTGLKNFIGAAIDLAERARQVLDSDDGSYDALVIALQNFGDAHRSLIEASSEALAETEISRANARDRTQ
ncbi:MULTISPECIES: hypothetical protein [Bradyrhizobium]|jgi:hypothetical protein|uniref:Uncharacterized protein n=1 Tax=Bradyrhizobium elkanii TaxID=29448 RepID=A0ABV4EQS7_BRAEL|nr:MULTISPECIES: hypothetical protein [Bradyrhizobium]MCP1758814.1 hypothetical protein [Bradyrhizobium elkanii]MCP1975831.1 hypothetical protein [Bradyrhizobium elkanii]MCP1985010.1 hypothetical protein [Bradyrhizobium elkanii]MCS3695239.1 hypothetical protein [Bradyrhizobium elkanii]MCS3890635.1 hypothetical protein [Bradyrhizobium elkanii]